MLLSYKPLHLEAQQRLQEGCVVDIKVVCDRLALKYRNTYSNAKKYNYTGKIISGHKYNKDVEIFKDCHTSKKKGMTTPVKAAVVSP